MQNDVIIELENKLPAPEDYSFLRKEGIRLIEKLAGKVWTDYNAHDPGITLLEAICYALTDLGYRTSYHMKDLLAGDGSAAAFDASYSARQILSSAPVTITDYRKLVIDTEGVNNAWIEMSSDYEILLYAAQNESDNTPALTYDVDRGGLPLRLRGLYKVIVEYTATVIQQERQQEVAALIKKKLAAHRNLCEDVISISSVEYEEFTMEAELQVKEGANIEKIYARVFHIIQNAFSPAIPFYTLQQMLSRGYAIEDIFEGPALQHGFLDTTEMENAARFPEIHLSDIIHEILKIDGVIAVKKCLFPVGSQSPFSEFTEWIREQTIRTDKVFRLDIDNSVIHFIRSGDKHRDLKSTAPDKERVKAFFNFLQSEKGVGRLKDPVLDIPAPRGEDMHIGDYFPFQYSLPAAYGLNEAEEQNSLPEQGGGTDPKKINRLQLGGYLMVFEQILADYLAQLSNLKALFSFDPHQQKTYFAQELKAIADAPLLFRDYEKYKDGFGLQENERSRFLRRNAIMDHLLARFGEEVTNYDFWNQQNQQLSSDPLTAKAALLGDYLQISNQRFTAFNASEQTGAWDTGNVAGLKKRIFRLLGIRDDSRRSMTSDWIVLQKKEEANGLVRYAVQILDPQSNELLLESNPYPTEPEARYIMRHILNKGYDRGMYEMEHGSNKYAYKLQMKNPEGDLDAIATITATGTDQLNTRLDILLKTLEDFAQDENFHLLEHILLRPKLDTQPETKNETGIPLSSVLLLDPNETPEGIAIPAMQQTVFPYRFKTDNVSTKNPKETTWKLSLIKDKKTEILMVDEGFPLKKDVNERMLRLKEMGADRGNYEEGKNADGYSLFSIVEKGRKLASSKKAYKKREDMEEEIKTLIAFFAFELNVISLSNDAEESSFADTIDPYSFQLSFFLPDWPERFRDPAFRHLLENTIYSEVPAHIFPHIFWLDYKSMKDLEKVYKPWLEEIAVNPIPDTGTLNNLIFVLNEIRKMN